jgi:hypothetical protein
MVEVTTQEYVYNISCIQYFLYKYCCDVAVAQINYPSLKHGLDALERNLDSFLHETCLLAEFSCHL